MGDRARRSRDGACSRYSIDTLFPGLSNNHNSSTTQSSNNSTTNPSSVDQMEMERETDGLISTQPSIHQNILGGDDTCRKTDLDRMCVSGDAGGGEEEPQQTCSTSSSTTRSGAAVGGLLSKGGRNKPVWGMECRSGAGSKRKSGSPLKPTTQPKQQMHPPTGLTKLSRKEMFQVFQPWVLSTYGDSAKTKTITKKKYNRIVRTLKGEEINNAENSKFRFWVKAKGFHIGPPSGQLCVKDERGTLQHLVPNEPDLYVPTSVKV
ncbi:Nucleolar protein 4 [Folsomia candida]|uniref:Nucleolar protein 4 n=1 Tax=Folsomia candida TaxID=158441 RepID=A0A226F2I1_FOLCA|nr:Nucleolar protein 4 [Folsomia candida]